MLFAARFAESRDPQRAAGRQGDCWHRHKATRPTAPRGSCTPRGSITEGIPSPWCASGGNRAGDAPVPAPRGQPGARGSVGVPGGSLLPRLDEDSRAGAATRPRSRRGRVWDLAAPLAGQCPVGLIFSPVLSQEEACHAASCWSWLSTAVSTALTWKCCAAGGCKGIQQGAEGYGVGFTSLPQPWISRGSRTAVLGLLWSPRACPGALCRRNWRG